MSGLGTFIGGAITGIAGLGIASWLIATYAENDKAEKESEAEEE